MSVSARTESPFFQIIQNSTVVMSSQVPRWLFKKSVSRLTWSAEQRLFAWRPCPLVAGLCTHLLYSRLDSSHDIPGGCKIIQLLSKSGVLLCKGEKAGDALLTSSGLKHGEWPTVSRGRPTKTWFQEGRGPYNSVLK